MAGAKTPASGAVIAIRSDLTSVAGAAALLLLLAGPPAAAPAATGATRARAFANAVNLTAADLPGFTVSPAHKKAPKTAAETQLLLEATRCIEIAPSKTTPSKAIFKATSSGYEHETSAAEASVHSSVSVAQSSNVGARTLGVFRSSHTGACLSHYLNAFLKSQPHPGETVSPVSVVQHTYPAAGTTGSFGWRITLTITVGGKRVSTYVDILGFVYGPAEVTLFTTGLPTAFPAATEQRLFSLLLARAKSNAGGTIAALAAAHLATLHLTATVYDVHTVKGVSSSREKVYEGSTKLGEDSSSCTQKTSSTVHCTGSYGLTHGTILFSGTISDSSNTNRLTITGGAGAYKGARGTVLTEYNRLGTKAKETITFT